MVVIWIGFFAFVLALLALDLGVFHRSAHVVRAREALVWSGVWLTVAMLFSLFVWFGYENHWLGLGEQPDPIDGRVNDGASATVKYLTGYVVEQSLSVDNLFVIAMIFGSLGIPAIYQHRVLFWGILGAVVMRGLMIGFGAQLVASYHWVLYVFGVFLVLTALKMLVVRAHSDPAAGLAMRVTKRLLPVTDNLHGRHFLVRAGGSAAREPAVAGEPEVPDPAIAKAAPGTLMLTPLAVALILVETADLVFAVDSVPAIFAITGDPFLVFTSNVFAILGLRSLYFAVAHLLDRFRYLKISLAVILGMVGIKMLLQDAFKEAFGPQFNLYLLAVVVLVLVAGVLASIYTGPGSARDTDA